MVDFPAVTVEMMFSGSTWTDVTAYVDVPADSITITRGSTRVESPVVRYEGGTCHIPLDNSGRRFDPSNLAGPYTSGGVTQILPRIKVRVSAVYSAVTYRLFNGFADAWNISYAPPSDSVATVDCSDGFRRLGAQPRPPKASFAGGGEDAGARVTRILNDAAWPAGSRSITAGDSTLQPTLLGGTTPGVVPLSVIIAGGGQTVNVAQAAATSAPLDELQLTADTEMGELYVNGNGFLVFRHRNGIYLDARSVTSQAVFGDYAGFVPWQVQWHGNGAAANPGAQSQLIGGITAGNSYQATALFDSPQGWAQAQLDINWWTAGGAYISTSGGPLVNVAANTVTTVTVGPVTAPATATQYTLIPQMVGTPASTVIMSAATLQNPPAGDLSAGTVTAWSANNSATITNLGTVPVSWYPGEVPYASAPVTYDMATLWNGATIANTGGNLQQAADAGSQAEPPAGYGPRVYDSENLLADSDWQAANYAQHIIATSKNPELRFETLTVDPAADTVNLFPQVLGREIGDRITIVRRPPGGGTPISRDVFIRGVSHTITDSTWATTWVLQDASSLPQPFILGDAVNGVLGTSQLGF